MTAAQRRVVQLLKAGNRLWWFGDNGPEMSSHPEWPQKRTVRILLERGVLRWLDYANKTQKECGICELALSSEIEPSPVELET